MRADAGRDAYQVLAVETDAVEVATGGAVLGALEPQQLLGFVDAGGVARGLRGGQLVVRGLLFGGQLQQFRQQFGYAPFPGTEGNYLAIIDTFVAAKQARNGVNALKFLETVADPATMLAFTKVKGSVPVRRDVSTATLSDYQRAASAALWHDTVLLSMTHGELMNTQFQEALYAAVKDYAKNKNQRAFINTVQRAGNAGPVGGR